ncbi:hypothetical protein [Nonlabens sp.]|uniref:hypothetical protein n=1 Tax=Nonlabens sp. TaxID=1888209 RepID=UPI003263C958
MKLSVLIILLALLSSCSPMKFEKRKLINKQNKGYEVYLDSIKVNFDRLYVDSNNVKFEIQKDKKIYFKRRVQFQFIELDSILDKYQDLNDDYLLVINGVPVDKSENIKFEINSITEIKVLRKVALEPVLYHIKYPVLLILTKR